MSVLRILEIENSCTGCGACASICPQGCITISRNEEGFYYPKCDDEKCVRCHLCEKTCHVLSNEAKNEISEDDYFMYADIDSVRIDSSSGGAFYRLAQCILSQNGVVYGSAFNPKNNRLEIISSNDIAFKRLQKSKYIESYSGLSFSKVGNDLKNNRKVLFCGTPCQVRGLKHYLETKKIDCANLITVDFICHGVPSSLCFEEYVSKVLKKNKQLDNVDFRNKRFEKNGQKWHDMSLRLDFEDNTSAVVPYEVPYNYGYYKLFMDNVILRKCCYNCNIPSSSVADFTIADFWGINMYRPEIDDNKGISVIKFHTIKAKEYWSNLNYKAPLYEPLPFDTVRYIYKKPNKTPLLVKRKEFFDNMRRYGYKKAIIKYYGLLSLIKAFSIGWLKTNLKMMIRHY